MPSGGLNSKRTCTALALAVLLAASTGFGALAQDAREEAVKAAFLYNFTKFVDWPESAFPQPGSPFAVCAFADATFRRDLENILRSEQVRGRPVTLMPSGRDDIKSCHLAYFAKTESDRQGRLLGAVRQTPVLTVGEGRRFLEQGGHIAFLLENDRVRFSVSKRGTDAAGLTVSSRLLRVARPFDEKLP